MKFTYTAYLFNNELKKYKDSIEVIAIKKMDLGAIVTFHCNDARVLDEIFGEE